MRPHLLTDDRVPSTIVQDVGELANVAPSPNLQQLPYIEIQLCTSDASLGTSTIKPLYQWRG
jgi:hypothetical protein